MSLVTCHSVTCHLTLSWSCYRWHCTLVFLQIKDTIGFDTLGHCFFLEDGVEQRNTLFHNLGLLTKPGTLLPTDRNNSMCTTVRDKVFGNYVPVPATDCMWVTGRERETRVWCSRPLTLWGWRGEMFRGKFSSRQDFSVTSVEVILKKCLAGPFQLSGSLIPTITWLVMQLRAHR